MLKNYLKSAIRNIIRNKTYSAINIIGLSIGLAASFMILLFVLYQVSYDKYNEKINDIYIVTSESKHPGTQARFHTPLIFAPTLKSECPEVKEFSRWDSYTSNITYHDKMFKEYESVFSDPEIFKILSLPLLYGDLKSLSNERNYLVLSQSTAKKYFGGNNPVGEIVSVECGKGKYDLKVMAVMKDIPKTSTFTADLIGPPYINEKRIEEIYIDSKVEPTVDWKIQNSFTYLLLAPGTDLKNFESKLANFSSRHYDGYWKTDFHLMPLKDLYFNSFSIPNQQFPAGNILNIYIYSAVAILILLIACVNYLMLNMGRSAFRTKEVGVRKVIGAKKTDLFIQITFEAVLVSFLSLPIALAISQMLLPDLSQLLGLRISGNYIQNWYFILIFVVITALIGIIAGSYTSFHLASINPIEIFRHKLSTGSNRTVFRRIIMASQMIIFIGLISASVIVYKQLDYFVTKDFGFNKENLIIFKADDPKFGRKFHSMKNELLNNPEILYVSGSFNLPLKNDGIVCVGMDRDDPDRYIEYESLTVDKDFIETMEMKMISGESFKNNLSNIYERKENELMDCILNESAVKEFQSKKGIGDRIKNYRIVGVVKDFNMHSLHEKIGPLVISPGTNYVREIVVRVRPGRISEIIKFVEDKSRLYNNGEAMKYEFFDDRLKELYVAEQNFAKVIAYSTGLAIFVACLGIFGMSLFVSRQRIKEIGIRKIMGASIKNIYYMITKEFLALIVISSIIAFPVSYYGVNQWLQKFAYRTDIDVWTYLFSVIISLIVVSSTISYQAIKAARANPVEALKYE